VDWVLVDKADLDASSSRGSGIRDAKLPPERVHNGRPRAWPRLDDPGNCLRPKGLSDCTPAGLPVSSLDHRSLLMRVWYACRRSRKMIRTIEAVIDENGNVRLLEPVRPGAPRRALVTILDERPNAGQPSETALLSEAALAQDWNRPEEDEAWKHLQRVR
jgi:hypothetical protein